MSITPTPPAAPVEAQAGITVAAMPPEVPPADNSASDEGAVAVVATMPAEAPEHGNVVAGLHYLA